MYTKNKRRYDTIQGNNILNCIIGENTIKIKNEIINLPSPLKNILFYKDLIILIFFEEEFPIYKEQIYKNDVWIFNYDGYKVFELNKLINNEKMCKRYCERFYENKIIIRKKYLYLENEEYKIKIDLENKLISYIEEKQNYYKIVN